MIELDIWENRRDNARRELSHHTLSEDEVIEAISMYLLANHVISFENTYEIAIDKVTR
jgi:hypothetical protein